MKSKSPARGIEFSASFPMHRTIFILMIIGMGCSLSEQKKPNTVSKKTDTTIIQTNDANTASADTSDSMLLPAVKKIKSPNGIYHTILPLENKIEQTIAFNRDLTYQLQEKYSGAEKDSVIITEGSWTPSDGFVWLYKDQVVRGRYKWKGDTLQYYSPVIKKNFSMQQLQDANENKAWSVKGKKGIFLFGSGNEPFWNIELDNKDSISFLLSAWEHPLKLKIDSSFNRSDSTAYMGKNDSSQIRVTVFPQFCSDGMSDYVYRNKVKVQYNHQVYTGCGIIFK